MSYHDTLTTEAAFRRYEDVRWRFPVATFPNRSIECSGLVEIAEQFDAFLLDSFGVLNVGETAIPGAAECLGQLRALGKQVVVLTNAASYTRHDAVKKYRRLGFDFSAEEVVSSRDVAAARLEAISPGATWGAVAAPEDRFEDIAADVHHWRGEAVDGFVLLSSVALTSEVFLALQTALREEPRPLVVGNPDLVAPRETGLSKEPGFYAHKLADALSLSPQFFGKPFGNAFDDALARLGNCDPSRVAMVGDTLHTDILGGCAAGAKTVLVRDHGLFARCDVASFVARSGIVPDFECSSI